MSSFKVDVVGKPNGFVVHIIGRAGGPESEQLEEQLDKLVALKPALLVLEMSKLEYVSSRGLSVLIRVHRSMKEAGGKVRMAAVPTGVMQLLQSVKLDNLVPIFHTVEDAMKS